MEVVVRSLVLEGEEFVVIKDKNEKLVGTVGSQNGEYYATIPYSELDEQGRMKRVLNGFQICLADSFDSAIKRRLVNLKLVRYMDENPNATDEMIFKKCMELHALIG